jgi:RimJ/RimL family protein N-acetyltransferase
MRMPTLVHPTPPPADDAVVLRPLRAADRDRVVAAVQDPLIRRFTASIPYPYGDEEFEGFLESQASLLATGDGIDFVIADAADDARLLGLTGLQSISWKDRRAAAGYWVAPWARGRGVATRALRLLGDWALGALGLVRVELVADVENVASQRVAEKAGFTREGVLARHTVMAGASRDCVIYGRVAT